jgi:hypothetical protein
MKSLAQPRNYPEGKEKVVSLHAKLGYSEAQLREREREREKK